AAGEAFDKTAKVLGMAYPGGPELARLAQSGRSGAFVFPRPMLDRPGFEFSFSGLKTAVALAAREQPLDAVRRADIARGVEDAIVETLTRKTDRAMQATGLNQLVVAGGVGANVSLRASLGAAVARRGGRIYHPRFEFCTDNAAMIAMAGMLRLKRGDAATDLFIHARSQWPLTEAGNVAISSGTA
ncbi:MAG: tRNA (adenosine(37)-N6)-threonylcarbamoyltransferase complex transferase subunit TsaD, partial [Pseudomonadota bacterium]